VTGPLHVSVLGAILAAGFSIAMVALLVWMLRVPRPVSIEVARAVHSVGAVRTIFVPILETYYSERAVELASRLGQLQKARLLLGYIVEVPRTLGLGVPLPKVEEEGRHALEQARQIVSMHGLEAEIEIVRAREAGEGISRVARDHDVDLIVLGISPDTGFVEGTTARVAESLFRHAPCEVIIDRLAASSIGAAAPGAGAEAPPTEGEAATAPGESEPGRPGEPAAAGTDNRPGG
jgi:nucleotide-binding universal stress UspA family protein